MEFELKLRKANMSEDLKQINEWRQDWEMTVLPDWWYPEDNYIIDGVIFASYYKTNSKLAYLENIVSSPNCPHEIRFKAVEFISKHVFKQAQEDGFNVVCGCTKNKSIMKNCNLHGMLVSKPEFSILLMDVRK